MSEQGLCCDKCFEKIAKQRSSAARLWLDLCAAHIRFGVFGLMNHDLISLRLLENMRFVTSTDTADWTLVKVHCLRDEGENSYFCKGNCDE